MNFKDFFKNPFKKDKEQEKKEEEKILQKRREQEAFAKIILDKKNQQPKKKKYKSKESCEIEGNLLKIGDKVICRTNEPYPLMVGKIVEFWDNEGQWQKPVPVVRNNRDGKKFNVHGVVRPYSDELMDALRGLKPLEQWNYLVPEEVRYTEDEMKKKEESFNKREKFLKKKAKK